MKRLGLSMHKVKAIVISHEHGDHIHGVATLSKKYQIPVYITPRTLENGNLRLHEERIFSFKAYSPFEVGGLTVTPFPKFHDASDAHSFVVSSDSVNVGVFTDIGIACENVVRHFRQCHAVFLEANYDEAMLENGGYPQALKNRIRGGKGHLSNRQAVQLFTTHRPNFMSHLFLSHLSRNNNSPKIVRELFFSVADQIEIVIATRERETKVYHITADPNQISRPTAEPILRYEQLRLFN
jgi:phosphoribosyl 1,2-cyclic phosphodiesterase